MTAENNAKLVLAISRSLFRSPFTENPKNGDPTQPEIKLFGTLAANLFQPDSTEINARPDVENSFHSTLNCPRESAGFPDRKVQEAFRVRNITAAAVIANPDFISTIVQIRVCPSMPQETVDPFWQGVVIGTLQGLIARGNILLNGMEVSIAVDLLGKALFGYHSEATSKGYKARAISCVAGSLEQDLSRAVAEISDLGGTVYFLQPFSAHFSKPAVGFCEQLAKQILIKSFARLSLGEMIDMGNHV